MNKSLWPRATFQNRDVLKLGTFIMLGLVVLEIFLGDIPGITVTMSALWFYAWRRDVAFSQGEETGQAVGREASELALRGVIVALMIGFFVSFFVDTLTYSLEALMYYGLAFVFGLKGIGLWFFMPETTVETELN